MKNLKILMASRFAYPAIVAFLDKYLQDHA